MNRYVAQAKEFLEACNATMEIKYVGKEFNSNWGEREKRNKYLFTITTPSGIMEDYFWDSLYNTHNRKKPTEYSVLSCLQKYDVGTMNDFFAEFGYEIHSADDMFRFLNTYNATVKEYQNLCRIFTPEQIKLLREIY